MGLNLTSSDVDIFTITDDMDALVLSGSSGTADIIAQWFASDGGGTIATGSLSVTTKMTPPLDVEITTSNPRICAKGDPARKIDSIAETTSVNVALSYKGGRKIVMTNDKRTKYVVTPADGSPDGLFVVQKTSGIDGAVIVPNAEGKSGVATITVEFDHVEAKDFKNNNLEITIIVLAKVVAHATPYPTYKGSGAHTVKTMSAIAHTQPQVYQQALVHMSVFMSDALEKAIDVTGHSSAAWKTFRLGANVIETSIAGMENAGSGIKLVRKRAGTFMLGGNFDSVDVLADDRATIEVSDATVKIAQLSSTKRITSLHGPVGTTDQIKMASVMSDGTKWDSLFSDSGSPSLPGAVTFTVLPTTYASVDAEGVLKLLMNAHENTVATGKATGAGAGEVKETFGCNLTPEAGDIDIGAAAGLPVPAKGLNKKFDLTLSVNTGGKYLGPFTFKLYYDSTVIKVCDDCMAKGPDLKSTPSAQVIMGGERSDSGGTYRLVTSEGPNSETVKADAYRLLTLSAETLGKDATTTLTGQIITLAENFVGDGEVTIGKPVPRSFVSGQIKIVVGSGGRRRRRGEEKAKRGGTLDISTPNEGGGAARSRRRRSCSAYPDGDTNADCNFNIVDASFTSKYVLESILKFKGTYGATFIAAKKVSTWPTQLKKMDADLNTVVDGLDSYYLARVVVGMTRFVRALTVIPTDNDKDSWPACTLSLEAEIVTQECKGKATKDCDGGNADETIVWFDLASTNAKISSLLKESKDTCDTYCKGTIEDDIKHTGDGGKLHGGLIRAERKGAKYIAAIQTDLIVEAVAKIGLSLIVMTIENGATGVQRVEVIRGPPRDEQAFEYSDKLSLALPYTDSKEPYVLSLPGFSPFAHVNNTMPSSHCANGFTPTFKEPLYEVTILENTTNGTAVVTVKATDDDPEEAPSSEVTYSLVPNKVAPPFAVNESTGEITSTDLFNFETATLYVFEVKATDGSYPFNSNTTKVAITISDLNDNYPIFVETAPHGSADLAFENATVLGQTFSEQTKESLAHYKVEVRSGLQIGNVALTVNATDNDGKDHSIIRYTYIGDEMEDFAFDNATGKLVKTSMVWWHENVTREFIVRATDNGGLASDARVTFSILYDFKYMRFEDTIDGLSGGFLGVVDFGDDVVKPYNSGTETPAPAPVLSTDATAVVHSEGLYYDQSLLRVVVQALADGALPSPSTLVNVFALPTEGFQPLFNTANVVSAACTTGNDGICTATMSIPQAWYEAVPPGANVTRYLRLKHGLSSTTYETASAEGLALVQIHRKAPLSITANPTLKRNVIFEMPARGVFVGETFRIPVKAHAGFSTASWQITVKSDPSLEITMDVDAKKWTAEMRRPSKTHVSAVSILADEGASSSFRQTQMEILCYINVKVVRSEPLCQSSDGTRCATVTGTVHFIESIKEKDILPLDSPAQFADRFTAVVGNDFTYAGKIVTISDEIVGMVSSVAKNIFLNTAVLNGKEIASSLSTKMVWAPRGSAIRTPVSGSITCKSSDSGTMHVNAACTAIVLDGTETPGSATGPVTITLEPLEASKPMSSAVSVVVWTPRAPIAVAVDNPTLRPVSGWRIIEGSSSECTQQYQRARVTATATFVTKAADGEVLTAFAPVTKLIESVLKSKDASVASVSGGLVQGVYGTGTGRSTQIFVENPAAPATEMGSVDVSVSDLGTGTATVAGLEVYMISGLSFDSIQSPLVTGKETLVVTVRQSAMLSQIDQMASVATFALFEDGHRMHISASDGVTLVPKDDGALTLPASLGDTEEHMHVVATGTGEGDLITAKWQPDDCTSTPLGTGKAYGKVAVPAPSKVEITAASAGPFTNVDDPLTMVGISTSTVLKVELIYPGSDGSREYRKDVTGDPGTIIEGSAAHAILCTAGNHTKCGNIAGAVVSVAAKGAGEGTISVRFENFDLTDSITFTVIRTKAVEVRLHPFPVYPAPHVNAGPRSENYIVKRLHRYANPYHEDDTHVVMQQAIAHIYTVDSNGKVYALPLAGAEFNSFVAGSEVADTSTVTVDSTSRVVTVAAAASVIEASPEGVAVAIGATLPKVSMAIAKAQLLIVQDEVTIDKLEYPRLFSQLADSRGTVALTGVSGHVDNLAVGASFSDGRHHPELITKGGNLLFPGLLEISSKEPAVVSADDNGVITLNGNSFDGIHVEMEVRGAPASASTTLGVACNLDPVVGDVDLGRASGLPLGPNSVGQEFSMPIRINIGNEALGAFDLTITYDPTHLEAIKLPNGAYGKTGRNWPGGIFEATVDPPGTLKLGGVPRAAAKLSGNAVEVAVVNFRGIKKGLTEVNGVVNTMVSISSESNLVGQQIGGGTPRAFLAGEIGIFVEGGRRQRRHEQAGDHAVRPLATNPRSAPANNRRQRRLKDSDGVCRAPPCRNCLFTRDVGDANGDCIFDISDVAYVQVYLAERIGQFKTPMGTSIAASIVDEQIYEMDANQDGRIDAADARYLARVNFGILRFVRQISIRPVQDVISRGLLVINVTTLAKGNVIPTTDLTAVYMDVSHHDAGKGALIVASDPVEGEKMAVAKNSGLFGSIFLMKRVGPVFDNGHRLTQPTRCREPSNNAQVCQNATRASSQFWFNKESQACETLGFQQCLGSGNIFETHAACVTSCAKHYLHTVELETPLVAEDIGASFLVIAYDSLGRLATGRDAFLTTAGSPYKYSSGLDILVKCEAETGTAGVYDVAVVASTGYTPLVTFNNTLASAAAVNDYSPTFVELQWNLTASEATNVGTLLATLYAQDQDVDLGYPQTFSFVDDGAYVDNVGLWRYGPISLNPDSADVILEEELDYENTTTYSVVVSVTDNSPPQPRSSLARINIFVEDFNDHAPEFFLPEEHAVIGFGIPAQTALIRLLADDQDTGENALLDWSLATTNDANAGAPPFKMDSTGMLYTTEKTQSSGAALYTFDVRVTDLGTPSLSSDTRMTVAVLDEESLFKLILASNLNDFGSADEIVKSGSNKCIAALDRIFVGDVIVHEVVEGLSSVPGLDLTELSFYVVQRDANTISTAEEVTTALMNNIADPVLRRECAIFEWQPEIPQQLVSHLQFFADPACSVELAGDKEVEGGNGACLADSQPGRSGRVFCDGESASPSELRVYDNAGCNTPLSLQKAASAALGNGGSVLGGVCSTMIPFGTAGPEMYVRASCRNPFVDFTTTSVPDEVDGSGDEGDTVGIADNSQAMSTGAIAGFAAGAAIIWMIILMLILRYRRQRKQLVNAKLLVLASQGDVQFGTPEPMHKDIGGGFSGGEIDPVTGEMTLYKTGMDVDEGSMNPESLLAADETRLPSMWGGQRANPLMLGGFGGADMGLGLGGMGGGLDFDGGSDDDSEGLDSLGNLSDFEDADFEAFADSLLDDNLDDELFGYNRNPEPGAAGAFRNPPAMGDADSLSDFENGNSDDDLNLDDLGIGLPSPIGGFSARAGSIMGSPAQMGHVNQAQRMSQHEGVYNGRDSISSLDLDAEIVVASTTYEDVGQAWQTRQDGVTTTF